ncbi:hypothetical protein [Pseudacidovorax intermedius]|uniref:hypothetical protein n=1 Tax=Pseudacidovorax intermedius TaxID=433924 RepID=UPI0014749F93|nr:hypothetical protein [Pseudacidovorax intermedius]
MEFQQTRLKQASARDQLSIQQVEMAQFAAQFVEAAKEKGLMAGQWVGRGVDIREPKAKRRAAVDILSQAQSFRGQVFSAEEFDIAATDATAGLFGDVTQDFQVVLKGRSMFRVAK